MNVPATRTGIETVPTATSLPPLAAAICWIARRWPWWKGQSRIMDLFNRSLGGRTDFFAMTPLQSRLRMKVPLVDLVGRRAVAFGENDADLFRFLKLGLASGNPDRMYVDIGANLGIFLLRIAEANRIRCIGFEPQPNLSALLRENIAANDLGDLVEVRSVALGSTPGIARMSLSPEDSGVARVADADEGVEVPISTLEAEIDIAAWKNVPLLKIDVEGFELEVFQGAAPLFAVHRPTLVLEVNIEELKRRGRTPRTLGDFLRTVGYTDFRALDKFVYPIDNGMYPVANVIAVGHGGAPLLDRFGVNPHFRPTSKTNWAVQHYDF